MKKFVLFLTGKLGYEMLALLYDQIAIKYVFLEKEHDHETIKYYEFIIKICEQNHIPYTMGLANDNLTLILKQIRPDYIVSFGYRRMINKNIRQLANVECLGSHFAPLPRYRGFAPLNWVLINGEEETAVNLFTLADGVDEGKILAYKKVKIDIDDDINTLFSKCIEEFKLLFLEQLEKLEKAEFELMEQDESQATYTCSRNPEDGEIDWTKSAEQIHNLVRALTYPYPCAFTFFENSKILILEATIVDIPVYEGIVPGKIFKIINGEGIYVLCGKGAVFIKGIVVDGTYYETADKFFHSIRITLGKR